MIFASCEAMTVRHPAPNHLKAWREYRGLTQEQLGELSGTTGPVISLLEGGKRGLTLAWLLRLAPHLGTSPGSLLDHDPERVPIDVLDLWAAIPADERGRALQVLQAFTKRDAA